MIDGLGRSKSPFDISGIINKDSSHLVMPEIISSNSRNNNTQPLIIGL
jgi:hypothetical protein